MGWFNRFRRVRDPAARVDPRFPAPKSGVSLDGLAEALRSFGDAAPPPQVSFKPAQHPPGSTPPANLRMAMDSSLTWAGDVLNGVANEGMLFPGYAYLSLLAQRPEYRVIAETIATEATRKWIEFKSVGDEGEDKTEKLKQLADEFDRLQVRDHFCTLSIEDNLFGRSHLFMDFGTGLEPGDKELTTSIGDGRDAASVAKVKKGSLKRLQTVEAIWTYPTTYNAVNPLKPDWYRPQVWYTQGIEVHRTRLLTFIGHPVPDLLKPAYSFGGISLSQLAEPYVKIWLDTRESIGKMIHSFSVMVLMTDLSTILTPSGGGGPALAARVNLFNQLRDNGGTFVVNKASEDFKNVSASLAGLHELQAQSQEHMMSVARIPAVKFTGISPAGLNASSEGEIRVFYDTIAAYQNSFYRPNLTTLMHMAMLSLWGEVDEEITFEFVPLWALSEKEEAELRKIEAETGQVLVDTGAIGEEEERRRVAADPNSPYLNIDVSERPSLADEEEGGLEPEGGRPDPEAVELGQGNAPVAKAA